MTAKLFSGLSNSNACSFFLPSPVATTVSSSSRIWRWNVYLPLSPAGSSVGTAGRAWSLKSMLVLRGAGTALRPIHVLMLTIDLLAESALVVDVVP